MHFTTGFSILFMTVIALSGCQHLNYQPPTSGPTAKITFTSNNIAVQPMVCVPGKGMRDTEFAVAQKPFESSAFDELNIQLKKKPQVTVAIPAQKPATIAFRFQHTERTKVTGRCTIAMRFTPEETINYQARFHKEDTYCGMELLDQRGLPVKEAISVPPKCK